MNRCPCKVGVPINNPVALLERLIETTGYLETLKALKAAAERDLNGVAKTKRSEGHGAFLAAFVDGCSQAVHHVSPTFNGGIH